MCEGIEMTLIVIPPKERKRPVTMIQQLPRYTNQSTKKKIKSILPFFRSTLYKQPTKHQTTQM